MKLEAGKWYRARDGSKWHVDYANACVACGHSQHEGVKTWFVHGAVNLASLDIHNLDLISEWTEPAVGSNAWANSLPVGTKIRWHTWPKGDHVSRIASGWEKSCQNLKHPGETGGPGACAAGWCIYTEPKLRPWRHDEVPLGAWMSMEGKPGRYLITGANEFDLIVSGIGSISYEQAFNRCKLSLDNGVTWKPCGVSDV